MFFYFRWYLKKRTQSAALLAAGLSERENEVARLIAEIDRITDRDSQLVEDRILKLKAILEETDKRIAVYLKELEKSNVSESLYTSLGRGIRDALSRGSEEKFLPADVIDISPEIASVSPPVALAAPPSVPERPEVFNDQIDVSLNAPAPAALAAPVASPPSRQQIRAHIDLLLNEGLPPEEIASRLEISVAEVNLAINLRRRN